MWKTIHGSRQYLLMSTCAGGTGRGLMRSLGEAKRKPSSGLSCRNERDFDDFQACACACGMVALPNALGRMLRSASRSTMCWRHRCLPATAGQGQPFSTHRPPTFSTALPLAITGAGFNLSLSSRTRRELGNNCRRRDTARSSRLLSGLGVGTGAPRGRGGISHRLPQGIWFG